MDYLLSRAMVLEIFALEFSSYEKSKNFHFSLDDSRKMIRVIEETSSKVPSGCRKLQENVCL